MRFPSPSDLLAGPIFQKEMRVAGRRKSTYWTRGLFALALFGLTILVILGMIDEYVRGSAVEQMQRLQMIAPAVTVWMVWFQFIVVQFIAAAMTGGSICDERRARTLAVLATTPLRPSQIVLGKLLSRMAQVCIISLLTLPLLLALRAFGGVEATFIFAAAALTVSAGLMSASLALFSSCTARRATNATSFAVLVMVLYNLLPLFGMLMEYWSTGRAPSLEWMKYSPGFALFLASNGALPVGVLPSSSWVFTTAITLGLTALICLAATYRLGLLIRKESGGEGASVQATVVAVAAMPVGQPSAASPDPSQSASPASAASPPTVILEAHTRASRTVGDNPVLWRELRQPSFRSPLRVALAVCAILIIAFIVYANVGLDEAGTTAVFAAIASVVLLSQAATISAGAVTGEVEARTWPTLITTTLTPAEIVTGKIAGAIRQLWLLPALLLLHCLAAILGGANRPVVVVFLALAMIGPVVFLVTTGVYFSLRLRKTAAAGVVNFLLGGTLWAALPMFWVMLFFGILRFREQSSLPAVIFNGLICGNPVYLAGIAGYETRYSRSQMRFEFPSGNLNASEFFLVCLVQTLVYLALAFVVYRRILARFGAWSARRA